MSDDPASLHDSADWFEQKGFRLRFGWGPNGLRRLAPGAAVVVIIDVLSFSTSVDVALGRRAIVLPYRWHDGSEQEYAEANEAVVASKQPQPGQLSLRPSSLTAIAAGTRLVLPSPNGSALTFAAAESGAGPAGQAGTDDESESAGGPTVIVGSLRNATAVGRSIAERSTSWRSTSGRSTDAGDGVVAVIAAGERWRGSTGPLRPAIEDLLGAGAILRAASRIGTDEISPEARVAMAAFTDAEPALADRLRTCGSGQELIGRGFGGDVELAAELDRSAVVPTLRGVELVDGSATAPATRSA